MKTLKAANAYFGAKYKHFETEISPQDRFQLLSIEIGDDGNKISKKVLKKYIEDFIASSKDLSEDAKEAFIQIDKNWLAISNSPHIRFNDMKNYRGLLLAATSSKANVKEDVDLLLGDFS